MRTRTLSLLILLTGCVGDPDIDVREIELVAIEPATARFEPIPEAEWRAAEACGDELPAEGSVVRVAGEGGLRAWVARADGYVLCVDSAQRFAPAPGSAEPAWASTADGSAGEHTLGRVVHERDAASSRRTEMGEPSPEPMTQAGEPSPEPMTQAGEPSPEPMTQAREPS